MTFIFVFCLFWFSYAQKKPQFTDNMEGIFKIPQPVGTPKKQVQSSDKEEKSKGEPIRVCLSYDSEDWKDGPEWEEYDDEFFEDIRTYTQGAAQVMKQILNVAKPQDEDMYFLPDESPIYQYLKETIHIPDSHIEDGVSDCDLMVWVGWFYEISNTFIKTVAVQTSSDTNRPQFAAIWYNLYLNRTYYKEYFQSGMQMTLSALIHNAGFSYSLFKYYPKDPRVYESGKAYIASPKAVNAAREHFGCDQIEKLPLEGDGESGTKSRHWEQTFIFDEILVSINSGYNVLTNISLGLLEDSGWYYPNYTFAERSLWGYKQGCNFLQCQSTSETFWEFCTKENEQGIEPFFRGMGTCTSLEGMLECPVNIVSYVSDQIDCTTPNIKDSKFLEQTYQKISRSSVAFISDLKNSDDVLDGDDGGYRCFEYNIIDDQTLKIRVGDKGSVTCSRTDQQETKPIDGIDGFVECPSARLWDYKRHDCFDDCGRLGYCHAGECICFEGSVMTPSGKCICEDSDDERCLDLQGLRLYAILTIVFILIQF